MRKLFVIGLSAMYILYGCTSGPKNLDKFMVNLSEFKMDSTVLKDGDSVRILGSSGNLTKEHKINFYSLVVVKSLETGDTINVLLTDFFMADLNNPKTQFISNTSLIGKIYENALDNGKLKTNKINDIKPKSFDKVFYDSDYIQVDVRKYPTIIGNFGKYITEDN